MITGSSFLDQLRSIGVDVVFSVPCSGISSVLTAMEAAEDMRLITPTSEAEAVGMAVGAWTAGAKPVLLIQTSGLLDALNPLASLAVPGGVPLLVLVSWRGMPGHTDEPHHQLAGGFSFFQISEDGSDVKQQILEALVEAEQSRQPVVVAIPPSAIAPSSRLAESHLKSSGQCFVGGVIETDEDQKLPSITRLELLIMLRQMSGSKAIFISTAGYTARDLNAVDPHDRDLYLGGAMGCASALGCGLAIYSTHPVIVIDGDGACLMRLGNLATIGSLKPRLVHVVVNNGRFESTGNQKLGAQVSFAELAIAAGYPTAYRTRSAEAAGHVLRSVLSAERPSPALIEVLVAPIASAALPRPNISTAEQLKRLRSFVRVPLRE